MATQSRLRPPNLQTVWSEHENLSQFPRPSPHSARHSPYSPTTRSPSMPNTMYPRSPGYDHSMRRHERAMVDSLDARGRHGSQDARNAYRSLSPIAEANWNRHRSSFALSPASPHAPAPTPISSNPRTVTHGLPISPNPVTHGLPIYRPRNQTLAAETRSILLAGAPPAAQTNAPGTASERRQSLPPSLTSFRRNSQQERQELQAWGHVFFGNGSEANCFVSAVSLRRSSESSSGEETPGSPSKGAKAGNRVTIRARVRPCALGRKPFLITRAFDMDELRATIPQPPPSTSVAAPRKLSADLRVDSPAQDRRRFSAGSDASITSVRSSSNTVPIHLRYARAYLPVLAALIYSGHIEPRDIIDLPLPHPEVWTRTVAYVYTGQGELTDAMKQNILYLGGKV